MMNWHKFKRGFFVLSIIFLFFMNFLNVGNFILNSKFLLKDSSVFCQDKLNFLSQDFTTGIIPNPSVSYNRTNASNYANYYCDKYCHDGYYYLTSGALNTNSTTCSKQIDSDYEPGADCAHFVSCCIGDHQGSCSNADNKHPGGGLKLGKDHPENNAYGRSSCLNLATDLLNKGYAVSVSPVDELEKGDVIIYNYSNNKTFYEKDKNHHAVFYTGNSKVHAHSNHTEPNNPLDWWENEYEPLNANTALFIKIGYKYTSDCWVRIPPLVTPYVNVRNKAGGSLIGEAEGGAIGKVVGGPISATLKGENYFWYKINFESGATVSSGWVASMYLRSIDNPHLFNVNDKIKAKYPVKSRKGPGKKEQNIANISSNTIGTVLEIATYSDLKYSYDDGYTWVKVKWDNGYEGWSAQNYLEKTSSCTLLTVTTKPATDITSTSAKLNAVVNPNGQETEVLFFYGTDRSNLNNHTSFQPIGKGNSDVNVSEVITGLKPNTTYYFKAYAECPSGGVDGEIKSFKTLPAEKPEIKITSPRNGETIKAGDQYTIEWNAINLKNKIYIWYHTGNEEWIYIAGEFPPSQISYLWTVPDTPSENCYLLVGSGKPDSNGYFRSFDAQDQVNFKIRADSLDDKLPDLQAISYNVSSWSAKEDETLQVLVNVSNKGEGAANPSNISLYLSPYDDGKINDDYFVEKKYVGKLLPNDSQEINFSFSVPDLGSGTYNIWLIFVVDCDNEVKESNESNIFKGNKPLEIKDSEDSGSQLSVPRTINPSCGSTINVPPTGVTFTWSSVSGATYYEFELYKNNYRVANGIYSGTSCSWDLGDKEDEYLCWRVRACNNSGCSQWSDSCCFTKKVKSSSNTLPTVTTKPATDITSTSAKLNAVVNPNGQETEVLFFYGTDRSNLNNHTSFQPIGKGNSDVNVSEVITGLKPNTTYYFKAYAECPSGGVDGEIKSFKTLEEQTPPDNKPQPPKNLTATAGDGYVELSWNAVSSGNLQGYRIYRGTSSGKESFYDAVPQTRTSYKNTNVNNGTTYYYYVTALDKNGNESEPSNRVSATPNKSGGGNPPSDDKVKLTLYVHEGSSNGPTVSGASISGYDAKNNYFSKTTNNSGYAEIEGVAGNWSFKVTKSGYKENKWNQSITSTCTKHAYIEKDSGSGGGNEKPQPPKNLKAEVVFDSSTRKAGIRITWDAPSSSSVTKYRMYRKEESGSYSSIGDRDSAYTTFRDWSITLGNKYYYKVTSINNSGESDYSNEANVIAGVLVNTNAKLNVRKGAGLSYDVIVTLPKGTYGLALGGPTKADGYYWWYCYWNYNNNNYFGWSIEDGLDFYKGPLSIKEPIDVVTCFACNNFRFPILYLEYL